MVVAGRPGRVVGSVGEGWTDGGRSGGSGSGSGGGEIGVGGGGWSGGMEGWGRELWASVGNGKGKGMDGKR